MPRLSKLCSDIGSSRNSFRKRKFNTCVDTLTLKIPKSLRWPRCAPPAPAARKVGEMVEALGVARLSKDQVSTIAASLDANVEELLGRPSGGAEVPYV